MSTDLLSFSFEHPLVLLFYYTLAKKGTSIGSVYVMVDFICIVLSSCLERKAGDNCELQSEKLLRIVSEIYNLSIEKMLKSDQVHFQTLQIDWTGKYPLESIFNVRPILHSLVIVMSLDTFDP